MNSGVNIHSLNVLAENPPSVSVPVCGDGVPTLSHPSEENSNSSLGTGVPPRVPEPPDLADRSSQSSLASLDDAGPSVCFFLPLLRNHTSLFSLVKTYLYCLYLFVF